jgi:hypothetical protein
MKTARIFARSAAVALLVLVPAALAQRGPDASARSPGSSVAAANLPVTRVVLFTSGIGYFEHAGIVEGNAELELTVSSEQMDDLLQSLVLQDFHGGTIRPIRYSSRDPLGRILASYSLDLSSDPTFAELLSQARGEAVSVSTTDELAGVVVNVERVQPPEEEAKSYLTLATGAGLRRIDLAEVRGVRFQRPEVQAELDAALAALAEYRGSDDNLVRLIFSGEGPRRVNVGYVREMPVWKTSYRLVTDEAGLATLQGWAIFDNPTDVDLDGIEVSFVAGQPISFISSLFEPVYLDRPRVDAPVGANIAPPAYQADLRAPAAAAGMAMERSLPRAAPLLKDAGVSAMAQGASTGATFEYRVTEPVSIARHESAMIPIIQGAVEVEHLSIFDPDVLADNPLRALRLTNDTGLHLAAGPVTVFGDRGFMGNSRIEDIVPGDSRVLSYAVDLDLTVEVRSSSEPEEVTAVSIRNGLVETSVRQRLRTEYRANRRGGEERFLVLEHPKRTGFELVAPQPAPAETLESYRFGMTLNGSGPGGRAGQPGDGADRRETDIPSQVTCPGEGPCSLTVIVERTESRSLSVSNVSSDLIAFYLENVELNAEDRAALTRIFDLKRQLARFDESSTTAQRRLDSIHRDQDRIRQNMAVLEPNTSLYLRYLADLEEQEGNLDAIESELDELRRSRAELQAELDRLLGTL